MVTVGKDLPGQPRLLHVKAKIPPNLNGSPILNKDGRVLGVYGAPASPPDQDAAAANPTMKDIHFAALVNPEMIRLGIEKRDDKLWVTPKVLKAGQ
jgi:hypothetical protein